MERGLFFFLICLLGFQASFVGDDGGEAGEVWMRADGNIEADYGAI